MKAFRNVALSLCVLLLLYIGAYAVFARKVMRVCYDEHGRGYASEIEWNDWRKIFVPLASLDFRVNVERPAWKGSIGHWESESSTDFVKIARDGLCSFRIGKFEHAGKVESNQAGIYGMEFTQDGRSFDFNFFLFDFVSPAERLSSEAAATVRERVIDPAGDPFGASLEHDDTILTRVSGPD